MVNLNTPPQDSTVVSFLFPSVISLGDLTHSLGILYPLQEDLELGLYLLPLPRGLACSGGHRGLPSAFPAAKLVCPVLSCVLLPPPHSPSPSSLPLTASPPLSPPHHNSFPSPPPSQLLPSHPSPQPFPCSSSG